MMALLAVLLIVGGAATAGLLAVRMDAREQVLALNQDVAPGARITTDMLGSVPVASDGLMLVPAEQASDVVGTYARVAMSKGQLLDVSMLVRSEPLDGSLAVVGVPLSSGRVPAGLRSGDLVRLIRLEDSGSLGEPMATALVMETSTVSSDDLIGGGGASSSARLLVPADAADQIVGAAGQDKIGAALIGRGVAVDDADLEVLGGR